MYEIDGVPLSDPQYRWRLHRETTRRTPVAIRAVDAHIPGLDGSLPIWGEDVEATALHLELNVYGTPAQVEERCGFLRGLLGKTHAPLVVGRRGGLTADAKLASISEPIMTDRYARISAVLTIPAGVWRGPVAPWTHPAPRHAGPQVIYPLEGGTRPITDSLLLITGPATGPMVTDAATGSTLRYTGEVPAGQRLLIDCAGWRATRGAGVSWESTGTDATTGLAATGPRSAHHLLPLTPVATPAGVTETRIAFAHTGGTAATALQVRARTSHL